MSFFIRLIILSTLFFSQVAWACKAPCDQKNPPRSKKPMFAHLDLNSDGVITFDEFIEHKLPRGDHDSIFSHIDQNKDDQITEEEWLSHRPPKRSRAKGNQRQGEGRGGDRR
ncbi:EF-hand domain-containing protein [Algibacillus agarilyticus]|uniref:EF-hand domain-containing protein n=1 Tax=Algibacillus agarilyticus TaxID=2234133 RepID=UPI000DD0BAFB|nr:EF-hand domain-containing protein [Algibacillus agarilyticus]